MGEANKRKIRELKIDMANCQSELEEHQRQYDNLIKSYDERFKIINDKEDEIKRLRKLLLKTNISNAEIFNWH